MKITKNLTTELQYPERSVFMKEVNTKNFGLLNWEHKNVFPDAAGRAPEKQFCFSPEGADSPYETYFPIACTTVPFLQPIGLAMVD